MPGSLGGSLMAPQQMTGAPQQAPGLGVAQGAPANQAGMSPAATGFQPASGGTSNGFQPQTNQAGGNIGHEGGNMPQGMMGQANAPAFQGGPATNPGAPGGAASNTPGAPAASGQPTLSNQMTGGFNTNYVTPGTSAVHSIQGGPAYDQNVTDDYYHQQTRNLDPQWQQRQSNQEAQLANMGLSRGSAAWQRESDNLNRNRTDAYQTAQSDAIQRGGAESTRLQNAAIARGNFANQAGQQDYQNQITSQAAQNAGNTAQQNAAQGWEGFNTARYGADQGLRGAQANASASRANAAASAAASRYATESNSQIQNRQLSGTERGQDFSQALQMQQAPYNLQNLQMGGMYTQGSPTYSNFQGGQMPGADNSNYAGQINQAGNQGTNNLVTGISNAAGRIPWGSLGGNYVGGPQQLGGNNY